MLAATYEFLSNKSIFITDLLVLRQYEIQNLEENGFTTTNKATSFSSCYSQETS